jgi:hypothetical protein
MLCTVLTYSYHATSKWECKDAIILSKLEHLWDCG